MTRRTLKQKLAKLGITDVQIGRAYGGLDVEVWAPAGNIFSANQCHCIVVNDNGDSTEQEVLADVLEQVTFGMEVCGDGECEYCYPVEEN